MLFVTSRERTIQTPCSHEPATPGRSTGTEAAAGCAGWPVAAARHRVRMLGKRQQKAAVLMPATAAPSNTPRMPHTQLSCCQSAARVPMPPTPQAQPEIRARSCRQSPHRSSHHSGATVPRTIFCAFDVFCSRCCSAMQCVQVQWRCSISLVEHQGAQHACRLAHLANRSLCLRSSSWWW